MHEIYFHFEVGKTALGGNRRPKYRQRDTKSTVLYYQDLGSSARPSCWNLSKIAFFDPILLLLNATYISWLNVELKTTGIELWVQYPIPKYQRLPWGLVASFEWNKDFEREVKLCVIVVYHCCMKGVFIRTVWLIQNDSPKIIQGLHEDVIIPGNSHVIVVLNI